MKKLIQFLVWYILMWILIIPIGWFVIKYLDIKFDKVQYVAPLGESLFLLALLTSGRFRLFVWDSLLFPFNIYDSIETKIAKRRVDKLRGKKYVYFKNNA